MEKVFSIYGVKLNNQDLQKSADAINAIESQKKLYEDDAYFYLIQMVYDLRHNQKTLFHPVYHNRNLSTDIEIYQEDDDLYIGVDFSKVKSRSNIYSKKYINQYLEIIKGTLTIILNNSCLLSKLNCDFYTGLYTDNTEDLIECLKENKGNDNSWWKVYERQDND
jgi:hypothetical protein